MEAVIRNEQIIQGLRCFHPNSYYSYLLKESVGGRLPKSDRRLNFDKENIDYSGVAFRIALLLDIELSRQMEFPRPLMAYKSPGCGEIYIVFHTILHSMNSKIIPRCTRVTLTIIRPLIGLLG